MKKYPFVLFMIIFSAGIIAGSYVKIPFTLLYIFWGILLAAAGAYHFIPLNLLRLTLSIILCTGVFLSGMLFYMPPQKFTFLEELHKENITFYGTINDINPVKGDRLKFTAKSDSVLVKGLTIKYSGKFYCNIPYDNRSLLPGYKITLDGNYIRGRDVRNPGEFDYQNYLSKNGISGNIYSYNKEDLVISESGEDLFWSLIYRARKAISENVESYFTSETAGLVNGLLLGERGDIDLETKTGFINSGTAHVLAVSGLNVGYVLLIILILFGRFNLYLRSILAAAGIILYALISGASPSILRASLMSIILLSAFVSNRSTNVINSLAISAFIILVVDPAELFLPGFQLSFAAVISTALIYPLLKSEINKLNLRNTVLRNIIVISTVSIAAQVGTLPFILYYFSKLSFTSIIANLVVIPLTGFVLGAAVVTLIVSVISSSIALVFASSADFLNLILTNFVKFMGDPSCSFIWINDFSIADSLIFYTTLTMFFILIKKTEKAYIKVILLALIYSTFIVYTSFDNRDILKDGVFNCYMIDVGQGDAFLIKFPSGKTALIDAGQTTSGFDSGERIIEPLLNYLGINQIDYGFVSHLDTDHYSGFVYLIHKGYVRHLYKPAPDTTEKEIRFERFLKDNKVSFEYYNGGILKINAARIYFLDNKGYTGQQKSNNDQSCVFVISYGTTSFLFSGDAGVSAEDFYAEKYGELLKIDVLKVSHHGSNSATSEKFLYISRPSISLISAGTKNKYGHPAKEVIERLKKINSKIYRTDLEGGVLLQSDGYKIKKINWKEL